MTPIELERAVVHKLGSASQLERHAANLLPDDEILALARKALFAPLDGMLRWSLSKAREDMVKRFRHEHPCQQGLTPKQHGASLPLIDRAPSLTFETTELTEADAPTWDRLKAITVAAIDIDQHPWVSARCTVIPLTYWVTCTVCSAEASRSFAKVTVHWAGRDLVREYAL